MTIQNFQNNWLEARKKAIHEGLIINEIGWEQHVIIDEVQQIVYRYPRHQAAADKLADEVAVLADINRCEWPIRLPKMINHNEVCTSYVYILGQILDKQTLSTLNQPKIDHIGEALGVFLYQFHGLDASIVMQKKTKQSTSLLSYYADRIQSAQKTEFYAKAQASLQTIMAGYDHSAPVVVHGDLHGANILIDATTKQLVGVIDLSEMETGDPHQEFRKLFMTDPRLLESTIRVYHAGGGKMLNPEVIKAWAYANEWANVCHFVDQPQNATYQRALHHLQEWGQI